MSNSKKAGKGTSTAKAVQDAIDQMWASLNAMYNSGPPFLVMPRGKSLPSYRIYPGAVIPVDQLMDIVMTPDKPWPWELKAPLPPGIPLDEDIFNSLLFHWEWWQKINEFFSKGKCQAKDVDEVQLIVIGKFQLLYMEVLWRRIQKTK